MQITLELSKAEQRGGIESGRRRGIGRRPFVRTASRSRRSPPQPTPPRRRRSAAVAGGVGCWRRLGAARAGAGAGPPASGRAVVGAAEIAGPWVRGVGPAGPARAQPVRREVARPPLLAARWCRHLGRGGGRRCRCARFGRAGTAGQHARQHRKAGDAGTGRHPAPGTGRMARSVVKTRRRRRRRGCRCWCRRKHGWTVGSGHRRVRGPRLGHGSQPASPSWEFPQPFLGSWRRGDPALRPGGIEVRARVRRGG